MPVSCYLCIFINVGLGEGSALPVGVPVPWPSATPPAGWLKCNGAPFSAEEHPELAKAYPTNKLPDLRGEFIRGWDGGRGVDSGRALMSEQGDAIRNITGQIFAGTAGNSQYIFSGANGVFSRAGETRPNISGTSGTGDLRNAAVELSASNQVPTANENRPRNVAFNYIVRAA
ncbi:Phage tail collar domain-containing protein [Escherichia coli]